MLVFDRRVVVVGALVVACGDSAADDGGGSTGADSTQGDDDDDDSSPTSAHEGSSSDGGSEQSDVGVDTTAGESSTGAQGCTTHDECRDALAPACVDGTCSPCGDADASACSEIDAALPVCGADGGCVECTAGDASACMGNTPVCDESTSSCIRCTAHGQCPESACDIETGACFETDCIVDIDADGGGDYLDVTSALAGETDDACVLRLNTPLDPAFFYGESAIVDARTIALLGIAEEDERDPQILDSDGALHATGGAIVYVSAVSLTGGVIVEDATLYIDDSDLRGLGDPPLNTTSDLARVRLSNSWINHYQGNEAAVIVDAGEVDALYTTIVGATVGIQCDAAAVVSLRNSFVVGLFEGPAADCSPLTAEYTAFEEDIAGRGNTSVGEFSNTWFAARGGSILRLSANPPVELATTARWTPGDPTVDIDGDPRPDRDGAEDFAGADVFVAP